MQFQITLGKEVTPLPLPPLRITRFLKLSREATYYFVPLVTVKMEVTPSCHVSNNTKDAGSSHLVSLIKPKQQRVIYLPDDDFLRLIVEFERRGENARDPLSACWPISATQRGTISCRNRQPRPEIGSFASKYYFQTNDLFLFAEFFFSQNF